MLTPDNDIRQEILDNWEYLEELNDNGVDDYLTELADSRTPIYTKDIIEEWRELPSDYDDAWQEWATSPKDTIVSLMKLSLYRYYQDKYSQLYNEINTEKQEESED
jgi:hypothetical protein